MALGELFATCSYSYRVLAIDHASGVLQGFVLVW